MPETPPSTSKPTPPSPSITSITVPSRIDFRYSLPVVVLESLWHITFVIATILVSVITLNEEQNVPLRVWLIGRSCQRLVHVIFVLFEYHSRTMIVSNDPVSVGLRFVRNLEEIYTEIFKSWCFIGLFYIYRAGKTLSSDAPRLLWWTEVVLAPDLLLGFRNVFFVFRRLLSTFISFLSRYQRAASMAEINNLPKYGFKLFNDDKQPDERARRMVPMGTNGPDFSAVRVLPPEDARCCICLCNYEDGVKLNSLPCKHHFHATCLFTWLRIKATCPLCNKYGIN